MELQNLMNQLRSASNPTSMLMGMLNPNQKQMTSIFQSKSTQEQAEEIANKCNQLGISKEQFQQLINMLKK